MGTLKVFKGLSRSKGEKEGIMNNKKWKDFKMSREQRKEDLKGFKYSQSDNEFFKEGEYWTISYGGKTIRLKDTVGLQYIVCLLRNPNHKFHVMQLAHNRNKNTQKSIYKNMNLKLLKNELLSISLRFRLIHLIS